MSLDIINSADLSMARGKLFGAASEEFLPGSYEVLFHHFHFLENGNLHEAKLSRVLQVV